MGTRELAVRPRNNLNPVRAAGEAMNHGADRGVFVNMQGVKLAGSIRDISQAWLYADRLERVTIVVDGAEPLYAELRLPNHEGWVLGQKVLIMIIPAQADGGGAH